MLGCKCSSSGAEGKSEVLRSSPGAVVAKHHELGLRAAAVYFLTIQVARSPKCKVWAGLVPPEALREDWSVCSQLLAAVGAPWLLAHCSNLCLCLREAFSPSGLEMHCRCKRRSRCCWLRGAAVPGTGMSVSMFLRKNRVLWSGIVDSGLPAVQQSPGHFMYVLKSHCPSFKFAYEHAAVASRFNLLVSLTVSP